MALVNGQGLERIIVSTLAGRGAYTGYTTLHQPSSMQNKVALIVRSASCNLFSVEAAVSGRDDLAPPRTFVFVYKSRFLGDS